MNLLLVVSSFAANRTSLFRAKFLRGLVSELLYDTPPLPVPQELFSLHSLVPTRLLFIAFRVCLRPGMRKLLPSVFMGQVFFFFLASCLPVSF